MNIKANGTFPAEISEIENVYGFISRILSESGLDAAVATLFELAADEIFSNIVKYGYESEASRTAADAAVYIAIHIGDDAVSMTFRDRGNPFDPLQTHPPDLSLGLDERPVGGLGIHIVKNSFDDVRYSFEEGFNVFTLIKLRKRGPR
ncbi:MAG: ATP-binding protein [Synergistaceae bacterium]|jgi:anti-sigma regulatory factor (Ser/Thr protein kinase)|nr:ATP-binding protein [Synergistaceae bacterium]